MKIILSVAIALFLLFNFTSCCCCCKTVDEFLGSCLKEYLNKRDIAQRDKCLKAVQGKWINTKEPKNTIEIIVKEDSSGVFINHNSETNKNDYINYSTQDMINEYGYNFDNKSNSFIGYSRNSLEAIKYDEGKKLLIWTTSDTFNGDNVIYFQKDKD